jgi:SOS regulatory protein LexA
MNKLTAKQKNILELIQAYIEQKKENPTTYKLQKHLSTVGIMDSIKSIVQVVEALEKKDLIRRDEKKIYLVENDSYSNLENIISIPLYGLASCGEALSYASDQIDDYLQVSKSLFERTNVSLFAVKALGDSMDKDGIRDGDYVIFEKFESQCELEGRIVVAVINGLATIKRYKKVDKNVIGLFPNSSNSVHHPIYLHNSDSILIAGVFRKVLPVAYVSL